jgi:hypothetical protein
MDKELTTIIFRANPKIRDMIDKLKEERCLESNAEVMRAAIVNYYETFFKSYGKDTLSSANILSVKQPKLTKEQKEERIQHDICMALNGKITDKDGNKSCTYTIYEKVNPKLVNKFEQTLPVSMLNKDTISRQYYPSKEEVEQILEQE